MWCFVTVHTACVCVCVVRCRAYSVCAWVWDCRAHTWPMGMSMGAPEGRVRPAALPYVFIPSAVTVMAARQGNNGTKRQDDRRTPDSQSASGDAQATCMTTFTTIHDKQTYGKNGGDRNVAPASREHAKTVAAQRGPAPLSHLDQSTTSVAGKREGARAQRAAPAWRTCPSRSRRDWAVARAWAGRCPWRLRGWPWVLTSLLALQEAPPHPARSAPPGSARIRRPYPKPPVGVRHKASLPLLLMRGGANQPVYIASMQLLHVFTYVHL